jgi:hypothetical protein
MAQLATFSDHLATRSLGGFRQLPSREEVVSTVPEMEPFQNDIPMTDFETPHAPDWPLKDTFPAQAVPEKNVESRCRKALVQKLIVPTAVVTIPMAIIAASLLGLVFGYRVKSDETLFPSPDDIHNLKDHSFVLVNFSASKYTKANTQWRSRMIDFP